MCALFFNVVAILGTGLVVKTMDDFLDEEDLQAIPYFSQLGAGVIPYSFAFFSLALAINFKLSFGLFWASYSVGMLESPLQRLPSKLHGGLETIAGLVIMLVAVGVKVTSWSILIIGAVQFIDDFMDYNHDQIVSSANLALVFGRSECFLLALIFLYAAVSLQPLESVVTWSLALAIGNCSFFRKKRVGACF